MPWKLNEGEINCSFPKLTIPKSMWRTIMSCEAETPELKNSIWSIVPKKRTCFISFFLCLNYSKHDCFCRWKHGYLLNRRMWNNSRLLKCLSKDSWKELDLVIPPGTWTDFMCSDFPRAEYDVKVLIGHKLFILFSGKQGIFHALDHCDPNWCWFPFLPHIHWIPKF